MISVILTLAGSAAQAGSFTAGFEGRNGLTSEGITVQPLSTSLTATSAFQTGISMPTDVFSSENNPNGGSKSLNFGPALTNTQTPIQSFDEFNKGSGPQNDFSNIRMEFSSPTMQHLNFNTNQ